MQKIKQLKQAKLLLAQESFYSAHKDYSRLERIKKILQPLIKKRHPDALWLKAGMPNLAEKSKLFLHTFDKIWLTLIKESAYGGCAGAQYQYGCQLYEKKHFTKALHFYKKAARQGYAPAQWCYGIDTLYGIGVPQNEKKAWYYIRLAAKQDYENAVAFLIRNHKENNE